MIWAIWHAAVCMISYQTELNYFFAHFRTGSWFEPILNLNWTSRTHSCRFSLRFGLEHKTELQSCSQFADFAKKLDGTKLWQH